MIDEQFWAELDENRCPCAGEGWAQTDIFQWKECPIHFHGQLHPESKDLLLDDPARLEEEDRKSQLRYKIASCKAAVEHYQGLIRDQQKLMVQFELELINKTVTVQMPAVNPNNPIVDEMQIDEGDFI
jgi:hypothetical protein